MLQITVPQRELYDEVNNEFIYTKEQTLKLEHSLVSVSKWESKWGKPFLTKQEKTYEEIIDYIRCMTLTQNVDPYVYFCLTEKNKNQIRDYLESSMTATTFMEEGNNGSNGNGEIVTSELIYFWMISLNIPLECQKWHLSRLITLIRVCNIKNSPPKQMSRNEILSRNKALNEARRKRLNTKG